MSLNFWKNKCEDIFDDVCYRVLCLYDAIIDLKNCRCFLGKTSHSPMEKSMGLTHTESTGYLVLRRIFKDFSFSKCDRFIDVGCGRGRVLLFLKTIGVSCEMYGVEINPIVANFTKKWSKKYDNINVIENDVFNLNLNNYSVFYLNRPFLPETFYKFIDKLESEVTHQIRFIYFVDQRSGNYLNGRTGWFLHKRCNLYKTRGDKGLTIVKWPPQRYSIWTFNPNYKNN